MTIRTLPFSLSVLSVSIIFSLFGFAEVRGQGLIQNGSFENSLLGWQVNAREPQNKAEEFSGAKSPMSGGNSGFVFEVGDGATVPPILKQDFATRFLEGEIRFDFRVAEGTTYNGEDGVLVCRLASDTGKFPSLLVIRGDGTIMLADRLLDVAWKQGVWYSVKINVPPVGSAKEFRMELKEYLQAAIQVSAPSPASWVPAEGRAFTALQFQTGFGARPVTKVFLDNVEVVPVPKP